MLVFSVAGSGARVTNNIGSSNRLILRRVLALLRGGAPFSTCSILGP